MRYKTKQIHGGLRRDDPTRSRGVGIYPTAGFRFASCRQGADLFSLSEAGNIYGRITNPTVAAYEQRVAALYGAPAALATSSGHAAVHLTLTALAKKGENIVASPYLYGGTYNLMRHTLSDLGIEARIAPSAEPQALAALCDDKTRCLYAESMGNPTCFVPDIEGLARVARDAGVPLVIDNTFGACGYLCNPFEHGADIVVESATKWINGHGTAMGGLIVDGGTFAWSPQKYPQIDGPSAGYHGVNLREVFGPSAFVGKCRVDGLRDFGCCQSPFDAYLMMLGLETLALRMDHITASTRRLAEYLRARPGVKSVRYVGFSDHESHANARRYFRDAAGAVLNVELEGDMASTARFVEALEVAANMVMIGDSMTVVTHPASTTHRQLSEPDMLAAGVTPTLLRLSPGLEDPADLIDDFERAFAAINKK